MFQVIQNGPSFQEKNLVVEESLTNTLQATFSLHHRVFLHAPLARLFLGFSTFSKIPSTLTTSVLLHANLHISSPGQSELAPGSERQHLLWPWARKGQDLVFHGV